jgi:hypothetical protein
MILIGKRSPLLYWMNWLEIWFTLHVTRIIMKESRTWNANHNTLKVPKGINKNNHRNVCLAINCEGEFVCFHAFPEVSFHPTPPLALAGQKDNNNLVQWDLHTRECYVSRHSNMECTDVEASVYRTAEHGEWNIWEEKQKPLNNNMLYIIHLQVHIECGDQQGYLVQPLAYGGSQMYSYLVQKLNLFKIISNNFK